MTFIPLCWRSVHDDVDPEDLHGIEGVGEAHHCGECDESQSCYTPAGGGGGGLTDDDHITGECSHASRHINHQRMCGMVLIVEGRKLNSLNRWQQAAYNLQSV